MLSNLSEKEITQVNQNVFFKEFTFDKNDFMIDNHNKVELADNVLWLDDLMIVIQIKEKDLSSNSSVEDWFKNKVFKKAKNQIKNTLKYLYEHKTIPIVNGHNDKYILDIRNIVSIHNVVIYKIDSWESDTEFAKKYITQDNSFIHFISFENYVQICRYVITPVELASYLFFREVMLRTYSNIDDLPERYFLALYFQNPTDFTLDISYLFDLSHICKLIISKEDEFYLGTLISNMRDTLYAYNNEKDYYYVIRELAKLNRNEMKIFKERLLAVMNEEPTSIPILLKRFTSPRTKCAFVLMRLNKREEKNWYNSLINFTLEYKYKYKLDKAVGVIVSKVDKSFCFKWYYADDKWAYNKELEKLVKSDIEFNGEGEIHKYRLYSDLIEC